MPYISTIGLEVHVQLKTKSKIFCGCPNGFGGEPNTQVCPVCLGYPGALPVVNEEAIRLTVRAGLMIGSKINPYSKFDRKNYFYPDMPKNYKISQYDKPLCLGGSVEIETGVGRRAVGITRIHLEEDVGKSMHFGTSSGVDFNRAGSPLMEIVTEPEIGSPDEAYAFLTTLREILLYAGVSECDLEKGHLRCDVNCSVRPEGQTELGTKIEIKNMNTFKGVHRALQYELARQAAVLEQGGAIRQETRRWDDEAGVTEAMRTKEYAHDYRYFPEPDLMPIVLPSEQIEAWRATLPERPAVRRARLIRDLGLPEYDAGVLVAEKAIADYFEETARLCGEPKAASNWIMTTLMELLTAKKMSIQQASITPAQVAEIIQLTKKNTISVAVGREVFRAVFETGESPAAIVEKKGLAQVSDTGALEALVAQAVAEHPGPVADYRAGKKAALQFLVGQVMRRSKGKANPQMVLEMLQKNLGPAG